MSVYNYDIIILSTNVDTPFTLVDLGGRPSKPHMGFILINSMN